MKKIILLFLILFLIPQTVFSDEVIYDGNWSGSGDHYDVTFTVIENRLVRFDISYDISCDGSSYNQNIWYSDWKPQSVADGTFQLSNYGGTYTGTFNNASSLDGIWTNDSYCGGIGVSGVWAATNESAMPLDPEPDSVTPLYFPHVTSGIEWETEICVINISNDTINGVFKPYNDAGESVSIDITVTLEPNARKEITVGNEFNTPSGIGYIIFESGSENIAGYTKFYKAGKYRVAVPAVADITTGDLYISHIASNDTWWTGVSLLNTTSTKKNLLIELDDNTSKLVILDGYEHKAFRIRDLYDYTPQAQLNSAIIKDADGVIGLELFGSSSQLSGILLKNNTVTDMVYPHFSSNDTWWTGIVAYNPSASSCTLTINPYTAQGMALASQTVILSGYEKYIGNNTTLGLPPNSEWLQIQATLPITGFELFGSNNNKLLGGYTGVNISNTDGIFAKIETAGWTGIAFVNIGSSSATVNLTAYDDSGQVIDTESVLLAGYAKMVGNPENIFETDITSATYIAYSSDQELVGFQLNGSSDNMMLDGLPGL
jgi:hypothetical protein